MNKVIKIVSVLLIAVMLATTISTVCFATNLTPNSIIGQGQGVATTEIQSLAGTIFQTLRNIAAVLLVVLIVVLGIKFMMGSTEEKAEYKKSFIPLIVGTALVLAATTVAGFIWDIFD